MWLDISAVGVKIGRRKLSVSVCCCVTIRCIIEVLVCMCAYYGHIYAYLMKDSAEEIVLKRHQIRGSTAAGDRHTFLDVFVYYT